MSDDSVAGTGVTPAIVLVEPQLGDNIGAAARAMANFGLTDLRLVNPRDGWPNERARAAASGSHHVIDAVRVFESVEAAIAELRFVYATTARTRDIPKPVRGPREAAQTLQLRYRHGEPTGILFGRERWGLTNEEIGLADEFVTFPVNPAFASLNLAQSVLLMSYEWMMSGLSEGALPTRVRVPRLDETQAPKADLVALMEHLERALEPTGYFKSPDYKPRQVQSLRAVLQRAGFTEPEVKVLRGVVAALEGRKTRRELKT